VKFHTHTYTHTYIHTYTHTKGYTISRVIVGLGDKLDNDLIIER